MGLCNLFDPSEYGVSVFQRATTQRLFCCPHFILIVWNHCKPLLCMFTLVRVPFPDVFFLWTRNSPNGIYQKVSRNCINCLIGAYLTASSVRLRTASLLLDRTPLWLHQLLFSDKHPQHPSWNPPTPPSILLPFTCFASWQHTVKWKHLLFPSLRCKQVSRGEMSDFPVFVSACPDRFVGADRHTCGSVNPANLWGWVQNFLQQQCLRLHPVFWHLERWIPKFYGGGFRMPFPSQHFRVSELNIWTENVKVQDQQSCIQSNCLLDFIWGILEIETKHGRSNLVR